MSDMKIVPNDAPVSAFLESIDNIGRREDAFEMLALMERVTDAPAKMWGASIIGFGEYDYKRADGSAHKFAVAAFSPRKANLVVYIMSGVAKYAARLEAMGKFKHSVSCLYLGRLKTLDLQVLEDVIRDDINEMRERYEVRL